MVVCGLCYYNYGMHRPLAIWKTKTEVPKDVIYCLFCDEERHPGGHKVRIFQMQGGEPTVVHIPHVVDTSGKVAELKG